MSARMLRGGLAGMVTAWLAMVSGAPFAAEPPSYPANMMTCGVCPEGYATTGVTTDPKICKEGDPTLVECVRLGANILAVCGTCPEGYLQVGASSVPASSEPIMAQSAPPPIALARSPE